MIINKVNDNDSMEGLYPHYYFENYMCEIRLYNSFNMTVFSCYSLT